MVYLDFTLEVRTRGPGGYRVDVRSPRGEELGATLGLDPRSRDLEAVLLPLEAGATDEPFLTGLGARLFEALFHGPVGELYRESLGFATAVDGRGLRLKLDLEPPEVAALPWELLYDPTRACFLGATPLTPLTRYLAVREPIRQLRTAPPVRVLVAIPAASGLDVEGEMGGLRAAFAALAPSVTLDVLEGVVTPAALEAALDRAAYHVLHVIGHGAFDGEHAHLYLNDDHGAQVPVPASVLSTVFLDYRSLKLVLLNVCQGAAVSATTPLMGLAPQLVRRGIPAVVAMRYPIPDDQAIRFAQAFYGGLCTGPDQGLVDAAVAHARRTLWLEAPGTRLFATPVLFLRSPEGVIFDLQDARQGSDALRAIGATYRGTLALVEGAPEDGEAAAEVAAAHQGLARVRRILRRRNACVAAVALLVFLAAWVSLFNVLGLDERAEQMLSWAGTHLSPPPWSPLLAIVVLDPPSLAALEVGRPSDLRRHHARVLPRLARAGARVIVLDAVFRDPSPHDHAFAEAIREAVGRGTAVLAAVERPEIRDDRPVADLRPEMAQAVTDWGVVGGALGLLAGHVRKMRLVELRGERGPPIRFLGLQAAAYGLGASRLELSRQEDRITLIDGEPRDVPIARITSAATGRRLAPRSTEPRVAEIFIRFSPLAALRQRSVSYGRLLDEPDDSSWWRRTFEGRVVLIGGTLPGQDEHLVFRRERRFGVHVLADGVNTILEAQYLRHVAGTAWHAGVLVALGLAGAAVPLRLPATRKPARRIALLSLCVVYVAVAVLLHAALLIVPAIAYDLAALCLGYWAVGLAQRRLARVGGAP